MEFAIIALNENSMSSRVNPATIGYFYMNEKFHSVDFAEIVFNKLTTEH